MYQYAFLGQRIPEVQRAQFRGQTECVVAGERSADARKKVRQAARCSAAMLAAASAQTIREVGAAPCARPGAFAAAR